MLGVFVLFVNDSVKSTHLIHPTPLKSFTLPLVRFEIAPENWAPVSFGSGEMFSLESEGSGK